MAQNRPLWQMMSTYDATQSYDKEKQQLFWSFRVIMCSVHSYIVFSRFIPVDKDYIVLYIDALMCRCLLLVSCCNLHSRLPKECHTCPALTSSTVIWLLATACMHQFELFLMLYLAFSCSIELFLDKP